jgi:hypothetical protein
VFYRSLSAGGEIPPGGEGGFPDPSDTVTGAQEYALITDFNPAQGDKLQLHGDASRYSLGSLPMGSALTGSTLLYESEDRLSSEMIAVLQSSTFLEPNNVTQNALFV